MKVLLRFINSLLTIAIIVTATAFTLSQVFTYDRISKAADSSGAYQALAKALPAQIASDSAAGNPAVQQQLNAAITQVATPDYIKAKFDNFFQQFDVLLRGQGATAVIDFGDLRASLRQKGVDLPADQMQPLVVQQAQVAGLSKGLIISRQVGLGALIGTVVLLVISLLISYLVGTYRSLGLSLGVAGFIYGLIILLINAILGSTANNLKLQGPVNVLTPSLQKFLTELSNQLRAQFVILALVLVVIGALLLIFSGLLPKKPTKTKTLKKPAESF
ncbi:MAG TPA: hypothetical protein VLF41_02120 [Candidatus Nanoarchaeia archaeon]|nr:hypothetical protein [Candidatus Nanoarchaeia archaeon]